MPVFEQDGAEIGYDVQGEGPPLLLAHSLMCNRAMWNPIAKELSRFFRVISIDFRGHGESSAKRPFTLNDLVEDCVAVLQRERVESCTVCGVSMGGMVAMRLALRTHLVSKLVLIDTTLRAETLLKRLQYRALVEVYRRFGLLPRIVVRAQRLMLGATTLSKRAEAVERFTLMLRSCDQLQLCRALEAVAFRPGLFGVQQIGCSTLVIVGDEDKLTPLSNSEELARMIPDSRLVVLRSCGHLPPLEVGAAMLDEVLEFLNCRESQVSVDAETLVRSEKRQRDRSMVSLEDLSVGQR